MLLSTPCRLVMLVVLVASITFVTSTTDAAPGVCDRLCKEVKRYYLCSNKT